MNCNGFVCLFIMFIMMKLIMHTVQEPLNPLNGQNIRVIWTRWEGNPKGLSGPAKGGVILDYLAARFKFTYEMVRVTENTLEPGENGRGLLNYLRENQSDLLVYAIIPSSGRYKIVDLTWPYLFDAISFLIPVPSDEANIYAVVKPFQWPVWLALAVSAVCVIIALNLITSYLKNKPFNETESAAIARPNNTKSIRDRSKNKSRKTYLFVFGNLLSQGGVFQDNRLVFRLVIGVWIVAAFILVQAYTSILFTYVLAPISFPLIDSANDIVENPDINLLLKRGGTMQSLFKSSNETLFMKLQARIDASPNSRCNISSQCINMITPGSTNVYADGKPFLIEAITEQFKKTGKCDLKLAKEDFLKVFVTFALPKGSSYTKIVSQGLLEIQEIGLFKYWDLWLPPIAHQCLSNIKQAKITSSNKKNPPALTLKNLTGAFIVLAVGSSLSFLVFLCEHITLFTNKKNRPLRMPVEK